METITKTKCPDELRNEFLPRAVGNYFWRYEQLVFAIMAQACEDYEGGYWDFFNLSNDGFYMALKAEDPLKLQWSGNFFEGELGSDAASIGVNLMALSALAFDARSARIADHFSRLRDFAAEHEEASPIFRFID